MSFVNYVWLIPLFPLLGFTLIVLGGYRNHKFSHTIAISGVLIAVILSQVIFWSLITQDKALEPGISTIAWFKLGSGEIRLGTYIDAKAAVMFIIVPFVCLIIFIYSIGYMHADSSYSRFFAYVSLFAFAMFGLVICDNLLALFIFWEIMGVCSYLLIGFWSSKPSANAAALKAFLVTKIGDIFMLLGLLILYSETGTFTYRALFQPDLLQFLASKQYIPGITVATVVSLLLFAGTIGKSAQFPLHIWLPDAMEGPTPVSALIHAATMVSAGIFLIIRMFPLLQVSQALPVIAIIGTFTALFASIIAIAQDDIKRVLAYSTISQLGYMVAAVGIGAYKAGLFHLMTHTFFKALLFLAAGSVIHSIDHGYHLARGHAVPSDDATFSPNNMMGMGGLLKSMPVTATAYITGAMTLAGFPLITAGFWSKDGILTEAWHLNQNVFWVLAVAAGITAFYITRQICLVFLGNPRTQSSHYARENNNTFLIPLLILAFFSLIVGWIGIPEGFPVLSKLIPNLYEMLYSAPAFIHTTDIANVVSGTLESTPSFSWFPMLIGIAFPVIGFLSGWQLYGRVPIEAGDEDPLLVFMAFFRMRWFYNLIQNRFYIDEIYQIIFIKPISANVDLTALFDNKIVDWIVLTVGRIGAGFSVGVQKLDDNVLDPDLSKINNLNLTSIVEWIDDYLIDEIVNILGFLGEIGSRLFHQIDERLIDGFVKGVAEITHSLGLSVRKLQNGLLSDYLWNAFLMVLLIIATISLLQ
jgi:NADH-quinone oxidoreductase subunit L